MKQDTTLARKFAALLKKLGAKYDPQPPPQVDPVTQLVIGFLQWQATSAQADDAFARIMDCVVDINELRVSHPEEIVAMIGQDYPLAQERVARLRESLNEIFKRERGLTLNSIASKGKKDQRAYLDSLPGIPPYVCAQVTLLVFGGHAIPVDEKLAALLAQEDAAKADADPKQIEAVLMRQVKAGNGLRTYLLLQAWADANKVAPIPAPKKINKKSPPRTQTKKTSKKTAKRTKKK